MNKEMKKKKGLTKEKPLTIAPTVEVDREDLEGNSPTNSDTEMLPESGSQQQRASTFKEDLRDIPQPLRRREIDFPQRPSESGYPVQQREQRHASEWVADLPVGIGQSSVGPYRGASRRPWSPTPYRLGKEYEGRVGDYTSRGGDYVGQGGDYAGRGGHYHQRLDYHHHRDPYYNAFDREFHRGGREYDSHRRYEEGRFPQLPQLPSNVYAQELDSSGTNVYGRVDRRATSPLPSTSAIVENEVRSEVPSKRPLKLDRTGLPQGQMATLLHGDIGSFVKDMDPTKGWDGQAKEARDRLRDRLNHDYNFYGDSTKLSEKYLRKTAGSALIQFRYYLNQMIDRDEPRPSDVDDKYWKALQKIRNTTESQEKSEKMAAIARGRGSKNTSKKAVEHTLLSRMTLNLGHEPYSAEFEKEFEKEWALVQQAQAERKKQRALANANNAATQATKDFEMRLKTLEAFAKKWEPELKEWSKTWNEHEGVEYPKSETIEGDPGNELALVATDDDKEPTKEIEEEPNLEMTDGDADTDKSESNNEDDSQSEEDADGEEETSLESHPMNVVEPEDESVVKQATKKLNVVNGKNPLSKPTLLKTTEQKSTRGVLNSLAVLETEQSKGSSRPTTELSGKGKQTIGTVRMSTRVAEKTSEALEDIKDGSTHEEIEKQPEHRAPKRQKVGMNSVEPSLLFDEGIGVEGSQGNGTSGKGKKVLRKTGKSSQAKFDSKGVKKGK